MPPRPLAVMLPSVLAIIGKRIFLDFGRRNVDFRHAAQLEPQVFEVAVCRGMSDQFLDHEQEVGQRSQVTYVAGHTAASFVPMVP